MLGLPLEDACRARRVWQLQDLRRGAGLGAIDALGALKSAWHGLAQVLPPMAALITGEGLDGRAVHSINETAAPIDTRLELACLHAAQRTRTRGTREANQQREPGAGSGRQTFDTLGSYCRSAPSREARPGPSFTGPRMPYSARWSPAQHFSSAKRRGSCAKRNVFISMPARSEGDANQGETRSIRPYKRVKRCRKANAFASAPS